MDEKNEDKTIDITNKSNKELIEIYSKISENILMLNNLLDQKNKEEAVKQYQKIKNKL